MSASVVIGRSGVVHDDAWTRIHHDDAVPDAGDVIIPLARWRELRDADCPHAGRIGVVLGPADDPATLADDLPRLALVAVDFPHFTDGRGFSTARLLRERYGWRGELRAVGDIARDVVYYLSRVGFDTFALRKGEDPAEALAALADFTEAYQAAVDRPEPLFRRRERAGGVGRA